MELDQPDWNPSFRTAGLSVWRLRLTDLEGDPLDRLRPLTTPDEHARARRYRFDVDRHRHLAGRGIVRALLAHRYGRAPRSISIVEGPHGKPRVKGALEDRCIPRFNIAHSADVVVVALNRTHPVGIDVETENRDVDWEGLAERVLTRTERERGQALPVAERADFFFHVWTCKEAFLKATGSGLQRAPRTIECQFDGTTVVGLDDADPQGSSGTTGSAVQWSPSPFRASEHVAGAVVRPAHESSSLSFNDASQLVNASAYA